ncbi:MAG: hypothetical protein M3256_11960, partial [Actinomycetota bacterium]|nr:hypothetical protein [Actinomycetota bacterium]
MAARRRARGPWAWRGPAVAVATVASLGAAAFFLPVGMAIYLIAMATCSLWPRPEAYRPDTPTARAAQISHILGDNLRRPWGARVGFGDPGEAVESEKSFWPPSRVSSWWGAVFAGGVWMAADVARRAAGRALAGLPTTWRPAGLGMPAASAVAAFLAWQAVAATSRATRHPSEAAPPVLIRRQSMGAFVRRRLMVTLVVGLGAVGATTAWYLASRAAMSGSQARALAIVVGAVASLGSFSLVYGASELAEWRAMVKARDEWQERWLAVPRLGVPPPIFVVAHSLPKELPTHEVVTFQIPPGADFASYDRHAGHLGAALSSDTVLIGAMAAYDDSGRPIPGSQQSLGFQVVYAVVPLGKAPHLRPGLDPFTQRFVIRHAFKAAFTALKLGAPELAAVTSLAEDESQLLVETQWKLSPGVVAEDVMARAKAVAEKIDAPW